MTFTVSRISLRSAQLDTMYPAFRSVSKWNVAFAKKSPLGLTACAGPVAAGTASLLSAACTPRARADTKVGATRPPPKTAAAVRRVTADLVSDIFISFTSVEMTSHHQHGSTIDFPGF